MGGTKAVNNVVRSIPTTTATTPPKIDRNGTKAMAKSPEIRVVNTNQINIDLAEQSFNSVTSCSVGTELTAMRNPQM